MGPPSPPLIKLAEAASMLGVGSTTLKRWTEEHRIACERTLGGHRRFARTEILRLKALISGEPPATSGEPKFPATEGREWLDGTSDPAEPSLVHARLVLLRSRCRDWAEAGDRLCAGVLTEIGERWSSGRMTCAEEHAMSRSLEVALTRISHLIPASPTAPSVVLACPSGERHTLGLTLVETVLRERGAHVHFLGGDIPATDLAGAVRRLRPAALGLSASSCARAPGTLDEPARVAAAACAETRARLLLGGGANWPPTRGAIRFLTLAELARSLDSILPAPVSPAEV